MYLNWDSPYDLPQTLSVFCFFQGKLDALWVLMKKGYDRVSIMRPQPGDKVSTCTGKKKQMEMEKGLRIIY